MLMVFENRVLRRAFGPGREKHSRNIGRSGLCEAS
jgi:hypothetical protein